MVCIYCGAKTQVINSRLQKRVNVVWRRRRCQSCRVVFTSLEQNDYENALVVERDASHIIPFRRDELFLSVYEACRHRHNAVADASALTKTILGQLPAIQTSEGRISRDKLVGLVYDALKRFDAVAAIHYNAFHSL